MRQSRIPKSDQAMMCFYSGQPRVNVAAVATSFIVLTLAACFLLAGSRGGTKQGPLAHAPELATEEEPGNWSMAMDRIAELQQSLNSLWCRTLSVMPNGGFCLSEERLVMGGNEMFDPMLCSAVEMLVGSGSVADLGAGLGLYGMCLLRKKELPFVASPMVKAQVFEQYKKQMGSKFDTPQVIDSWDGFDGVRNIETLSGGMIRHADLSEEQLWLGRQWDWVMSVEVGEHILPSKETIFMDNIVAHACKGVLLTWAVEGQNGLGHVNPRNNDYIKARMGERGLVNDVQQENSIRETLNYQHLKSTLMVFRFTEPTECYS